MIAKARDLSEWPFSRNTINLTRRLIEHWGSRRTDKFFKDVGLWERWEKTSKRGLAPSKPYRLTEIFHYVRTKRGDLLIDVIKEALRVEWELVRWERQFNRDLKSRTMEQLFEERHPDLLNSLKSDGFKLRNGEFSPLSLEETREDRGEVRSLLVKHGFCVALRHHDEAYENYLLSNWEAANAQIRTFLQGLFDEIALKLYPDRAKKTGPGGARRKLLEDTGFIESDKGGLVHSFFQMANTKGPHPGLSDEEDCMLRGNMSIHMARYFLQKLT